MEKLATRMYKGSLSQSQKLCIAWCVDSLAQWASTDVLGIVLGSGETEMNNTLCGGIPGALYWVREAEQ